MADEPRPPFVRFEMRSEEDREASLKEGHYVGKDVVFAIVTPVGSRDTIERKATDWLENVAEGVKQERIPESWLHAYRRALKDFEESRETPENGTPLKDWAAISPATLRTLLDINVRTIEDVAEANEETISRMGMGGRALKQKAIAYLATSKDTGKVVEEITALRQEREELQTTVESLMERLKEAEKKLEKVK